MTHPAHDAVEAARKKRHHPGGTIEGKPARAGRMDRKFRDNTTGAVDASSWRPPVAHDIQVLNQEVIDTSLDVVRGISDRRGDIPERKKYADGGRLTANERQSLPKSDFAMPGHGQGPKGAGSGSYPIPDAKHGRLALAMVSKHGSPEEKARVRAKVHAKYPDIGQD